MDDFELELKESFLDEAMQNLDAVEQAFLSLESSADDPSIVDQIFRLAHNLKGTSRAVGFSDIAEFTHALENLILKIKQNEIKIEKQVVSILLRSNDRLREMIEGLKQNMEAQFENAQFILELNQMVSEASGHRQEISDGREETSDERVDSGAEIELNATFDADLSVDQVGEFTASVQDDHGKGYLFENQSPPSEEMNSKTQGRRAQIDESIRVNLSKLESLGNLVGELVILQGVLQQHSNEVKSPLVHKSLCQLAKISKEIHETSMSLRMVPIKTTMQKMRRIVRDTSAALNKEVNLLIEGEDTEIDKTVLEQIGEPLVHIVRNAVDHGLESTEARLASGKPRSGSIFIRCFHEGNSLIIQVEDDGGGIDPEKIRSVAIKKGLITEKTNLSQEECIHLIFHPGFSTKEQISEISGRGVGMDVVRTNIENLSGTIRVDSVVGRGSVFRIQLPLTLAVIDGLIVTVGTHKYVFPLNQIHQTLRPRADMMDKAAGLGELLNLRGETLPVYRLDQKFGHGNSARSACEYTAIICQANGQKFAVLVDDIHHQQQIVIKELGAEIKNRGQYLGASILGDGMPALIYDLYQLQKSQANNTQKLGMTG